MAKVYTRQEVRQRRMGFQIFAGIYDFLAVIVGIIVIIACVALLVTIIHWVVREGTLSFRGLWDIFQSALVRPT